MAPGGWRALPGQAWKEGKKEAGGVWAGAFSELAAIYFFGAIQQTADSSYRHIYIYV
jgi:hypothetical protein